MLLGCIGDDFTGSSDLANTLVKNGMRTTQYCGLPQADAGADVEAGVVALKTRSIPVEEAVRQSLQALEWLQRQGCTQFLFKYCSTFDSTPEGNIGPVAEALADRLETASGSDAAALIGEASAVVDRVILVHEREDDRVRYPALLSSPHHAALLTSLGYAHSEIMRIAGLLSMMTRDLDERAPDPSLTRDAQRAIERLVVLVQLHNRQEDAIAGD